MSMEEIDELRNGLYLVKWAKKNGGGVSLAAVGRDREGNVWFSPTNWTTPDAKLAEHCGSIEKLFLLMDKRDIDHLNNRA